MKKENMIIAAIDVGKFSNIGTASTPEKVIPCDEGRFVFFEKLLNNLKTPLAIGFEAPLFIPGKIEEKMTCSRPNIDRDRPWTCTSSFQCLFPILNQFFATLKSKWTDASVFTSYEDFNANNNPHRVLIFESFISKQAENTDNGQEFCEESYNDHDADANLTIALFRKFCEKRESAGPKPDIYKTYLSLPRIFAHYHGISYDNSQGGLIVKSAKPFKNKNQKWCYSESEMSWIIW